MKTKTAEDILIGEIGTTARDAYEKRKGGLEIAMEVQKEIKPKLGDWIVVNHKLVRESQGWHRSWKIKMLPNPLYVLVVGVRMLGNGSITEDGQFIFREQKKAYLVAKDLRSTFYVYL